MDFTGWNPAPLLERLELDFRNPMLLRTALTHRSFVNEYTGDEAIEHNERLEFLGDAVIEYVVTEYLFGAHPAASEGRLTEMRSILVKGDTLARAANTLDMQPYILLARGQPCTEYILSCTLEALFGAINIDRGLPTARLYIDHLLLRQTREMAKIDLRDPKSRLQEEMQAQRRVTPRYEVLSATGMDHARTFVVAVFANDEQLGVGQGSSKKQAQTDAARDALAKVFGINLSIDRNPVEGRNSE